MTIQRMLIANRGCVANRIIRTCREMEITSVAVFSDVDAGSSHVTRADHARLLGPAPASESYLNAERLIEVAQEMECDAVHPGYGFLAESADFAARCERAGLCFVGPSAKTLELAGDKIACQNRMRAAGVPVLPGNSEPLRDLAAAQRMLETTGLPAILKASHGGGGHGTRVVFSEEELAVHFDAVQEQSKKLFNDDCMLLERYLPRARHIEVQLLADRHDNIVHLYDRECSIQRRHQKVIEEGPSQNISAEERQQVCTLAVRAAQGIALIGCSTAEFLFQEGQFYFMEFNPRLQVEHGVTEMITNVDIVRQQILAAAGEPLELRQSEVSPQGYGLQARVYAENPVDRRPAPGKVHVAQIPFGQGVRIDTYLQPGTEVPGHYDPMLAKVIVAADSKETAIRRILHTLENFIINGTLRTNIPLLQQILRDKRFLTGDYHTAFLTRENFDYAAPDDQLHQLAATLARLAQRNDASHDEVAGGKPSSSGWSGRQWRSLP